ncbi:patatin-like phospholipase family protein, partial [Acidisphaera rubrifaciens]|uniref:patatin-like phospholipase family protein n=1 Tax=Acidisphaera rubrifaciens TaxID=50715 RepID=UPI000662A066
TGCASWLVADTTPLPRDKLEQPGAERISRGGYRADTLPAPADAPDLLALVAFSGGGKRSASFGYGALTGMRDVMVQTRNGPRPLLDLLTGMSGVSGGSFPAAYYGLYRDKTFQTFKDDFLYRDFDAYIWGIYLLPWHWAWLVQPGIGTNDYMDRIYDQTMFHGAKYSDLQRRGRPLVASGATDISYGMPILFTQETFDLICSDLSAFPLSRAVAASNGFPGLFSPVTLTNRAKACGGRTPGWVRRVTPEQFHDPLSRIGVAAHDADRYLDANRTEYLHLSDGGVADNLALRGAASVMRSLSASDLRSRGYTHVRRLLVLSIDGQGAQDDSIARRKEKAGLLSIIGLVSGGQIDNYNFETLIAVNQLVGTLGDRLRAARCAEAPRIDGVRCDDVQATMIHISLRGLPPSPENAALDAIPTGLTIPAEDVDRLIRAGHDAVTGSAALRAFIAAYPPAPAPPDRRVTASADAPPVTPTR